MWYEHTNVTCFVDQVRIGRQKLGKCFDGSGCTQHGAHLDPMTPEHNQDQCCELPEKDLPYNTQYDPAL